MILLTGSVRCPHPKTQRLHIFYTNWGKLLFQIGAATILQTGANVVANCGNCYKLGQLLLQNKAVITNWGKIFTN